MDDDVCVDHGLVSRCFIMCCRFTFAVHGRAWCFIQCGLYFYLVPPTTAIQAWFTFDESLDGLGILGFILTALAVYFVVKSRSYGDESEA